MSQISGSHFSDNVRFKVHSLILAKLFHFQVCIHPDLKCDGRPNCEFAEDEDFTMCKDIYFEKKLVKEYASLICNNTNYPQLTTIATACDGIIECYGGKDEAYCSSIGSSVTIGLILIGVVSIYLASKLIRFLKQDQEQEEVNLGEPDTESVIAKYERDHENPDMIELINTHLLHIIYTHEKDKAQKIFRKVYDVEDRHYKGNNSDIFYRFRTNVDPVVVSEILEAKFPGLTQATIDCLEGCFSCCCSRFITRIQDSVTKSEWKTQVFQTISKIIKILTNFVDLLKDSLLTYSMLKTVGGLDTLINFPTNFSSVIIMISFSLIVGPLILSTLTLVLNNPSLIYKTGKENGVVRRVMSTIICILCSIINPVLLINTLEKAKDEARKEAKKNQDPKQISAKFSESRRIKLHYVHHLTIELGKYLGIL